MRMSRGKNRLHHRVYEIKNMLPAKIVPCLEVSKFRGLSHERNPIPFEIRLYEPLCHMGNVSVRLFTFLRTPESLRWKETRACAMIRMSMGVNHHIRGKLLFNINQPVTTSTCLYQRGNSIRDQNRMAEGKPPLVFSFNKINIFIHFL